MTMKRDKVIIVLCVCLASVIGGVYVLYRDYAAFLATPVSASQWPIELTIAPGANFSQLVDDLYSRRIIDNQYYLHWYAHQHAMTQRIKAGRYIFQQGATPLSMLRKIIDGKVVQHTFTIVEGWTFRQMLAALHRHEYIDKQLTTQSDAQIAALLSLPAPHPEGQFLPDTYAFPDGASDIQFLSRASRALYRYLDEQWSWRAVGLPLESSYEALILASIVEKETAVAHERPIIAGVFTRRLQKRMRLQTDPTVIYGLGEKFDGDIRFKDLKTDTPYNTYTRHGLPPTPIALPGRAAIEAVLHPAGGDSLYFVAKGDGSHQFSATLKEHNDAVRRYQRSK